MGGVSVIRDVGNHAFAAEQQSGKKGSERTQEPLQKESLPRQ